MTKWVTVRENVNVTANQHPGPYIKPLFERWTNEGWEIVSVMTLPPDPHGIDMCVAVGVLRLSDGLTQ